VLQVYLHSRGRRSRPLRHSTYPLNVYHNVRRLSVAVSSGGTHSGTGDQARTTARAQNWRSGAAVW